LTYFEFHLVFLLPPLLVLVLLQRRTREPWWPLALIAAIAFVYTTPWDNYLVAREVWTYPAGRVLATIGYVPVEEYAFFVLQTLLAGLWLRLLQARQPSSGEVPRRWAIRVVWTGVWLAVGAVGVWGWSRGGSELYGGLILAWAAPVLALMSLVGGDLLAARWRVRAAGVAAPTLYLWLADRFAIAEASIWQITDATRTGWEVAGLPVEEALFFLVTNVMVVQGLLLLERPALDQLLRVVGVGRSAAHAHPTT
jgi:lycopene cyclase domain-containing protein